MPAFNDITGNVYGRLTVVRRNGSTPSKHILWLCKCECGKETNVTADNLKRGKQVSCGCYNVEKSTTHGATRGHAATPEYRAWLDMHRRCKDVNHDQAYLYVLRGITVCERWKSFENFFEDMGKKPTRNHSLDRIYPDGNYEPSNCRWATGSQQAINQRLKSTNTTGHRGISRDKRKGKYVASITVNYKQMNLGYFDNIEDAIAARKKAEKKYHRPS